MVDHDSSADIDTLADFERAGLLIENIDCVKP